MTSQTPRSTNSSRAKPWKRWLLTGAVLAIAAVASGTGWILLAPAAWRSAGADPNIALDGWAGAIAGAVASAIVALAVVLTTNRAERGRLTEQFEHERTLAAEQATEARAQLAAQFAHERELAWAQRRIDGWSGVVSALREFLDFPIDDRGWRLPARHTSSAFAQWRLFLDDENHEQIALGAKRAIEEVIRLCREQEALAHVQNEHVRPNDPITRIIASQAAASLIVEIAENGQRWHSSTGLRRDEAAEWFRARPV